MEETLFKIKDGRAYFEDGRGYGAEECIGILNGLVGAINSGAVLPSAPLSEKPINVINYEDILDKRVIKGDNGKFTQKLKEWLDNDPDVIAEDGRNVGKDPLII